MTAPKYDVRRCTRETLELFAARVLREMPDGYDGTPEERRLRSEARVRTRAEIDREIGNALRKSTSYGAAGRNSGHSYGFLAYLRQDEDVAALSSLITDSMTAPEEP